MTERDFKSEYLICRCSVATNLVTSLELHSDLCFYAMPFLANYGTVPFSPILTPIAALLQAVPTGEYGTVPERLGRNEEQKNINVSKRCAVKPDVHTSTKP